MHAGPASKLKGIIDVQLSDAERDRTHDRFVAVYRQVHAMIRDEVAIAMQRAQRVNGMHRSWASLRATSSASAACSRSGTSLRSISSTPILFPPPARVVAKAIELAQDGTLWENASVSLQRIALGFFFGSLIGIPLGLAIGSFGHRAAHPRALHRVSPLHSGDGADHGGGDLVRHRRGLEDLPDHLHHRVHRHHQHRGRRERRGTQQDPRRAIAGRQPRAGLLVRRPAGDRALHPHRHAPRHGQLVRDDHRRRAGCRQCRAWAR